MYGSPFVCKWVSLRIYSFVFKWDISIPSYICVCRSLLTYMGLFLYVYGSLFVCMGLFLKWDISIPSDIHVCRSLLTYMGLFLYVYGSLFVCMGLFSNETYPSPLTSVYVGLFWHTRVSFCMYMGLFCMYGSLFKWDISIPSDICVCRSLLTYTGLFLYVYGSLLYVWVSFQMRHIHPLWHLCM